MTGGAPSGPAPTLLPCPFCSGAAVVPKQAGRVVIACGGTCGILGPAGDSYVEAVEYWNERHQPTGQRPSAGMIGFLPLDEQRKLRLAEREARRGVMVDRAEAKRTRKAKRRARNAKEQAYQDAKRSRRSA